eukprot:jgi/Astpho2/6296/Aster-08347
MTWGGMQNPGNDEAQRQLSYAVDQGINFIDTAEAYPVPPKAEIQASPLASLSTAGAIFHAGNTDRAIGAWLASSHVKREDIVSGRNDQNQYLRPGTTPRVTPEQIEQSVEQSLKRLGTDYLDLLQVHWPDRYVPLFGASGYDPKNERPDDVPFEVQLEGLARVVKAGKVRHIGVSNETSWGVAQWVMCAAQSGGPKIISIQNCYNLLVRTAFETDLCETCSPKNANVGLLAYSPLAGGVLSALDRSRSAVPITSAAITPLASVDHLSSMVTTGKYLNGASPKGARMEFFKGYMARYRAERPTAALEEYCKIAQKYGMTPSELALAWCKSRWFVTSTIIGATSMTQLKENLQAFDKEMPEEAISEIDAVYAQYKDPV